MDTSSPSVRCVARRAAALVLLATAGSLEAQGAPDTAALRAATHAQLAAARTAALAVADAAERERLLSAVLDEQIAAGDLAGAAATAREVGHDRGAAFTRAMCACVEAKRFEDAQAVARTIPDAVVRAWAHAHLASQRARPELAGGDTLGAFRRAVAAALAVDAALPRTDALMTVAYRQVHGRDTTGAAGTVDAARAALDGVPDPDTRAQRLALLAGLYAQTGRLEEGLRLARGLAALDDRRVAVLGVARGGAAARQPAVRAALDGLARDGTRIADPRARRFFLESVSYAYLELGDTTAARRLGYRERADDMAAPPSRADSAEERAHAGDFAGAIALVERIADPRRSGLKARAYRRIAWAVYSGQGLDSARMLLRRGHAAVLTEAGPAVRDELLEDIARAQLWLADTDGALETLRHVQDPQEMIAASYDLATSTFNQLDYAGQRRFALQLPHPEARAAVLAQTIERHIQGDSRRKTLDLTAERARADSISVPRHRARALAAVAEGLLHRADTAAAQALWRSLLADVGADLRTRQLEVDRLAARLVLNGDTLSVRSWVIAHRTPEDRARAQLVLGTALRRQLDTVSRRPIFFSNGPDRCTEEF